MTTNQLQVFNFEGNNVRTVSINNDVYWVAKDVCDYFGDTDHKRSISRLDDDERLLVPTIDSLGRTQQATGVNESGLYHLLFGFEPEKARKDGVDYVTPHVLERINKIKRFRKWVTSVVLPSIRKTGSYNLKQLSRKDLALMVIKEEEEKERLQIENDKLTIENNDYKRLLNLFGDKQHTINQVSHTLISYFGTRAKLGTHNLYNILIANNMINENHIVNNNYKDYISNKNKTGMLIFSYKGILLILDLIFKTKGYLPIV